MEYTKGYKFRIYPTKAQVQTIEQTLDCCRFVYNHFLALRIESWKTKKESVTYVQTSALLTELKNHPDYVWLKAVDSMALQESLRNLDRSYQNFFKKIAKYPRFKSKHNHRHRGFAGEEHDEESQAGKSDFRCKLGRVFSYAGTQGGTLRNRCHSSAVLLSKFTNLLRMR